MEHCQYCSIMRRIWKGWDHSCCCEGKESKESDASGWNFSNDGNDIKVCSICDNFIEIGEIYGTCNFITFCCDCAEKKLKGGQEAEMLTCVENELEDLEEAEEKVRCAENELKEAEIINIDPLDYKNAVWVYEEPEKNNINPSHYKSGGIEVIDVIEQFSLDFRLGNAVKYILRAGKKNKDTTREDIEKAKWYLQRWLDNAEEKA